MFIEICDRQTDHSNEETNNKKTSLVTTNEKQFNCSRKNRMIFTWSLLRKLTIFFFFSPVNWFIVQNSCLFCRNEVRSNNCRTYNLSLKSSESGADFWFSFSFVLWYDSMCKRNKTINESTSYFIGWCWICMCAHSMKPFHCLHCVCVRLVYLFCPNRLPSMYAYTGAVQWVWIFSVWLFLYVVFFFFFFFSSSYISL